MLRFIKKAFKAYLDSVEKFGPITHY